MKILVAFASKHGATEEIARSIGKILTDQGLTVEVKPVQDVDTVLPYNAFVVGSAIYMGSWLRRAHRFINGHAELLARQPTWLFSSGPIGSPPHAAAAESFDVDRPHGDDARARPSAVQRQAREVRARPDGASARLGTARAERRLPRMGRSDGMG